MAKHYKEIRLSYDPRPEEYYRNRIKSLEDQLENAQTMCSMKDAYIHDLEEQKIKHMDLIRRLKEAFIKEAVGNV